ncbi:MAG: hypothetical protein ABI376_03475 [Caulobacteraceae bacterium]
MPGTGARAALSRLGVRGLAVVGAYVAASATVLLIVILLRRAISPASLRAVLAFLFIAAVSSGLEPGTVRAALLGGDAPGADRRARLIAAAVKALVAAPFLAAAWRFADPAQSGWIWVWTPLVAFAGFAATDARAMLDYQGHHSFAIGLKQGSLAGGIAIVAAMITGGVPLFWAVGAATAARVALIVTVPRGTGPPESFVVAWGHARRLLADRKWMELAGASAVAAIGGSADRVLGLRFLPAHTYASYYVLYEILSKFWLLPYLLGPILFARGVGREGKDPFAAHAWRLTAACGAVFIVGVAGILVVAPGPAARLIGSDFGWPTVAFAAAVAITSLTQLRIAQLQAAGGARRVLILMAFSATFSVALFYGSVQLLGVRGLLGAWLVKSTVEFAAVMAMKGTRRAA